MVETSVIFTEDCKRLVISCHDCCRAKNAFLKNLPSRMSKQPPPWFNKMPILSHWNIKQKTEYFLKQSVSLVQNMVCLHRFVLGRSSNDGVSSYASPDGPFNTAKTALVFRSKAYQTNGKVEQRNQFYQGTEDRGFIQTKI